ncbi:hypothetical protein ACEPUD_24775 [Burkholderia ubonensis]|uniref:hypothetical protein n=1 Tax=Burkholderia ubonensis TaxID=101571 RepID=UPI00358E0BFC
MNPRTLAAEIELALVLSERGTLAVQHHVAFQFSSVSTGIRADREMEGRWRAGKCQLPSGRRTSSIERPGLLPAITRAGPRVAEHRQPLVVAIGKAARIASAGMQ